MAETTTPHYGWTKPDPGASANTWGATLNSDLDKVDSQVFTNSQRGVEIGTIVMFAGGFAPANWLFCNGQSLATTGTYAKLFAIINYQFGGSGANFNAPNLTGRFPVCVTSSSALGTIGGEPNHTLTAAEMPVHSHPVTIHDSGHQHGVTDPTHNHSQTPHTHGVNDPQHSHHQGFSPSGGLFTSSAGPGAAADTLPSSTGITIQGSGANINSAATGVSVQNNVTGVTATSGNAGSGAAHNNLPPFLELNFIIKYA